VVYFLGDLWVILNAREVARIPAGKLDRILDAFVAVNVVRVHSKVMYDHLVKELFNQRGLILRGAIGSAASLRLVGQLIKSHT
jgi:hypothetical protein